MARQIKELNVPDQFNLTGEERDFLDSVKRLTADQEHNDAFCGHDFPVIVHWDTQKKPWEKHLEGSNPRQQTSTSNDSQVFDADIYWKQVLDEVNYEMQKIGTKSSRSKNFKEFLSRLYPAPQQKAKEFEGIFCSKELKTIPEEEEDL